MDFQAYNSCVVIHLDNASVLAKNKMQFNWASVMCLWTDDQVTTLHYGGGNSNILVSKSFLYRFCLR
jgi:hypothetical protein